MNKKIKYKLTEEAMLNKAAKEDFCTDWLGYIFNEHPRVILNQLIIGNRNIDAMRQEVVNFMNERDDEDE
jgi:hypothetical protein